MKSDKKPLDKLLEDATYERLSKREKNLLLVYEDKTILLFGDPKERRTPEKRVI